MLLPDTFVKAVEAYAKPIDDEVSQKRILETHLDTTRFFPYADAIEQYHTLKDQRVLSSGCSSAGCVSVFLERGASRVHGVEVDPTLTNLAQLRFSGTEWEPKVEIEQYSGHGLPYENDTFDIISSLHVLEHTYDNNLYLSESFRVLKPGGVLFLEIPNRYFRLEQHTLIPYVHFLPLALRNLLTGCITKTFLAQKVTPGFLHCMNLLTNFHFPSPAQLMSMIQNLKSRFDLKVEDAFYHLPGHAKFRKEFMPYLMGPQKKLHCFRVVVKKIGNASA